MMFGKTSITITLLVMVASSNLSGSKHFEKSVHVRDLCKPTVNEMNEYFINTNNYTVG